ncbi:MAG: hypothetical protein NTW03_16280 [Verrucomicrobia bacterium]|nr:hypothetical protein [Verrucomicrobiota bacterium]
MKNLLRKSPQIHLRTTSWGWLIRASLGLGASFLVCLSGSASPGKLRTTDGKTYQGEISIEPAGFKITPSGGVAKIIALSGVAVVAIDAPERQNRPRPAGQKTTTSRGTGSPPLELKPPARRGVLLCDGSFLAWPVRAVEGDRLRLREDLKAPDVPLTQVARIQYGESPAATSMAPPRNQPGILLNNGDFVEGEIKTLSDGRVKVSSVLFGLQSYEMGGKVAAVVFRDWAPARTRYEIELKNGTLLRVDGLGCGKNALIVEGGALRGLKINFWELLDLRCSNPTAAQP